MWNVIIDEMGHSALRVFVVGLHADKTPAGEVLGRGSAGGEGKERKRDYVFHAGILSRFEPFVMRDIR